MHMVIRAIVYAEDAEGAIAQAESVFGQLVAGGDFDYYTALKVDDSITAEIEQLLGLDDGEFKEGKGVVPADSPIGRRLIEAGMESTTYQFKRKMREVRIALKALTDEQIMEDSDMVRHQLYGLGGYNGPAMYLYNNDAVAIRSPGHLHDVLTKYRSLYEEQARRNPHAGDSVWVAAADVHF